MSYPIHCSVRVNAISGVTLSRSPLLGANYRTRTRLSSERRRSAPSPAAGRRHARQGRAPSARGRDVLRRPGSTPDEAEAGAASLDPEAEAGAASGSGGGGGRGEPGSGGGGGTGPRRGNLEQAKLYPRSGGLEVGGGEEEVRSAQGSAKGNRKRRRSKEVEASSEESSTARSARPFRRFR
jgi:hypothetical protein